MVGTMIRGTLKQGMKLWIVTSERVRAKVTELREDLEDVVVEAREEYQSQADANVQADADSEATAPAIAPRQKATRTQAKHGERPRTSDDTKDAKREQTAKAV